MNNYDPQKALDIWGELISNEQNEERREEFRSHSCYALLALNRIDGKFRRSYELLPTGSKNIS